MPEPECEEERRTKQAAQDWRQQAAKRAQSQRRQAEAARLQRMAWRHVERLAHHEPATTPPWDESGQSGRGCERTLNCRPYETE